MEWCVKGDFGVVLVFLACNPLVKIKGLIEADDCRWQSPIFIFCFVKVLLCDMVYASPIEFIIFYFRCSIEKREKGVLIV